MAYTPINKSDDYFNTVLYTGNGSTQSITGVGFQPEWTWIKCRSDVRNHQAYDVVRGATKQIYPNLVNAEDTDTSSLTSFDSDGFSLGSAGAVNVSGQTFVSWNWLAGGTGVSNTQGSIASTVSANTTSGFSVVSYTGSGSNPTTVGHGLSQTPEVVIVKLRSGSGTDWITWGSILGGTVGSEKIQLNLVNGKGTGLNSSWFNNTAPTSSVFTVGTQSDLNSSGSTYIGYCFHSVKGYSKFGRYTGNGSTDGTFVYTGFKPAFVITKTIDASDNWGLLDNKRDGYNLTNKALTPNSSGAEYTTNSPAADFVSNGFKIRQSDGVINASGDTYIYMAFAENPFVGSDGTPTTAR